jgi:hypothetical protein
MVLIKKVHNRGMKLVQTGKRAFSLEIAAKNIPPEVVKLRSKNSQGAAGQMVRAGVM